MFQTPPRLDHKPMWGDAINESSESCRAKNSHVDRERTQKCPQRTNPQISRSAAAMSSVHSASDRPDLQLHGAAGRASLKLTDIYRLETSVVTQISSLVISDSNK